MFKTKTFQLTPEQMQAIWDGAERSGTMAGEPEWRQIEEERRLMKETELVRTRLFWILVDAEELSKKIRKEK